MTYFGIIPARAGSVGLVGKNKSWVAGKPMINWTLDAALASNLDRLVVTTDDPEIRFYARQRGIPVARRTESLASGDVHAVFPTIDAARWYGAGEHDVVAMLLPTVPERTSDDINRARDLFEINEPSALIGVREIDAHIGQLRVIQDQGLKPVADVDVNGQRQESSSVYKVTGGMFMTRFGTLWQSQTYHVPGAMAFFMPDYIDVDNHHDLKHADARIRERKK